MVDEKVNPMIKKEKKKASEQERTLYIRFPKSIENIDQIRDLVGNCERIKFFRQKSRNCFVVYSTLSEKTKNFKALKEKIKNDGSRIMVSNAKKNGNIGKERPLPEKPNKKPKSKKPVERKIETKRTMIVINIPAAATTRDVKKAFPYTQTAAFIQPKDKTEKPLKIAVVKLKTSDMVEDYLAHRIPWPKVCGEKIKIKRDKRTASKSAAVKEPSGIKIYDEGEDVSQKLEFKKKFGKTSKSDASQPDEDVDGETKDVDSEEAVDVEDKAEDDDSADQEVEDADDTEDEAENDDNEKGENESSDNEA